MSCKPGRYGSLIVQDEEKKLQSFDILGVYDTTAFFAGHYQNNMTQLNFHDK